MSIALRLNSTTGALHQFNTGEALEIDVINRLNSSGNMTIGGNLGAAEELQLGSATSDVRVLGDLIVDGSSTISTNETVVGVFSVEGDVNLGNNDGDVVNLGGGTSDVVNLLTNMTPGAGTVSLGTGITQYFDQIWLDAVNTNGPNLAAYDLNASGTNAGAYAIGVDPSLLANATATDLMTALDELDAAISAGSSVTLQQAYQFGNTIDVTSAEGTLDFANDTTSDTTTVLQVSRTPGASTGGIGIDVNMGANTTGTALRINQQGGGDALDVQDGGSSVLRVTNAGQVIATPTSGQDATITTAGGGSIALTTVTGALSYSTTSGALTLAAGAASSISTSAGNLTLDAAAGELVFDDTGNSGLTLSQSGDRTLDQTASGEVLNGATSVIGALNRIARDIEVNGKGPRVELPIENGVTISAGDVVGVSTTSGRVTQANGNAAANIRVIGTAIVGGTGDAGGTVDAKVALNSAYITDSGAAFTAGDALFVPDGTGRPTATAPANDGDLVQRVGWAVTSTTYFLEIGVPVVL